jgi:YHS domain-containing protein
LWPGAAVRKLAPTRQQSTTIKKTNMKELSKITATVVLLLALAWPAIGQSTKMLVNIADSGVAIQGYDPVAFFTDNKPVKGDPKFISKSNGAIYFFASQEHRDIFALNPGKYEPAFGGYCAYGVSKGKLAKIDVSAFEVKDGKLLLQHNEYARDNFDKDPKGNLTKADVNWPTLVEKNGK